MSGQLSIRFCLGRHCGLVQGRVETPTLQKPVHVSGRHGAFLLCWLDLCLQADEPVLTGLCSLLLNELAFRRQLKGDWLDLKQNCLQDSDSAALWPAFEDAGRGDGHT